MQLSHISSLLAAIIAITPSVVNADGCHTSDDSIGKTCKYFSKTSWENAAKSYCGPSGGHTVIEGQSYPVKTHGNPDGAGGQQIFWGNFRIDRGGDYTIRSARCKKYMTLIYNSCGGYGGWINTSFGTVFGECIRV